MMLFKANAQVRARVLSAGFTVENSSMSLPFDFPDTADSNLQTVKFIKGGQSKGSHFEHPKVCTNCPPVHLAKKKKKKCVAPLPAFVGGTKQTT